MLSYKSSKPNLDKVSGFREVPLPAVFTAKADGGYHLGVYQNGVAMLRNRREVRTSDDLKALKELEQVLSDLSFEIHSLVFKAELYVRNKDDEPLNLQYYNRNRDSPDLYMGIFDIVAVNGEKIRVNSEEWFNNLRLLRKETEVEAVTYAHVLPYKWVETSLEAETFWKQTVNKGYEGVVAHASNGKGYKIKPSNEVDVAVIGINKTKALKSDGEARSLKTALMLGDTYIVISDVASGISSRMGRTLADKLLPHKIGEDSETIFVKPQIVYQIEYHHTYEAEQPVYDLTESAKQVSTKQFYSLREPRITRLRTDKEADNPRHLRPQQLPEYNEPFKEPEPKSEHEPEPEPGTAGTDTDTAGERRGIISGSLRGDN